MPDFELCLFHEAYHPDTRVQYASNLHPVQFRVLLSGIGDAGDYVYMDAQHGYCQRQWSATCPSIACPCDSTPDWGDVHLEEPLVRQLF